MKKNRFYGVALLKTSFEMRNQNNSEFEEILNGLLENMAIERKDFEDFLGQYRRDLQENCKKKGYL